MSTPDSPELYRFTQPIVGMIWAQTNQGVIGADGGMPWQLPEDMAQFKRVTMGHPVVMGRKTWDSFPAKFRPLPGRTNIVVTRQEGWGSTPGAAGAVVLDSLDQALVEAQLSPGGNEVWVLGGGQVFAQAMDSCNVAAITVINTDVPGDTQAPALGPEWSFRGASPVKGWHTSRNGTEYRFTLWAKGETEFVAPE
ncbi:dihydrofolate reductase [Arthrobacter silviterrae]|uniref:Dihydrofolate reductase n=1 Tax=Arthrobacter silviterrae TaxID=2026658 RepID=A0ABX0DCB0_9MICC|nr:MULTISPECIES: dihydrofolate reductase [Arthrobacter]MDQ0277666.1 dihydrofolate reductase [Arthrobacter silviterrae]NGN84263.1 dihydrofolate reductase [Arthrobacter silviterrae]